VLLQANESAGNCCSTPIVKLWKTVEKEGETFENFGKFWNFWDSLKKYLRVWSRRGTGLGGFCRGVKIGRK